MWSSSKPKANVFSTASSSSPPTWPGTRELAERQAEHYSVRFEVVVAKQETSLKNANAGLLLLIATSLRTCHDPFYAADSSDTPAAAKCKRPGSRRRGRPDYYLDNVIRRLRILIFCELSKDAMELIIWAAIIVGFIAGVFRKGR